MHKATHDHEYTGYGCPDTEMWQRRAEFEAQASPRLNLAIRTDAPHYDSWFTRAAYFAWEKQHAQ